MTRHDDTVALRHMRDHAAEAVDLACNRSRADLDANRLLSLGLTRLVEIVGEAAYRVSSTTRDDHPSIPWGQIVATRNRLIHGYDQIDLDVLWRIVSLELPLLIRQLDAILSGRSETGS